MVLARAPTQKGGLAEKGQGPGNATKLQNKFGCRSTPTEETGTATKPLVVQG